MENITVTLTKTKLTKNTVVYDPEEGQPVIGRMYLPKWFVGDKYPEKITVTVMEG